MKKKIIIATVDSSPFWVFPRELSEQLTRRFEKRAQIKSVQSVPELEAEIVDADALLAHEVPRPLISRARRLRWIHSPAAGVGSLLVPEVRRRRITVTNSRGTNANAVADHVLALLLGLSRRLHQALQLQQKNEWNPGAVWRSRPAVDAVCGKTLSIVGFGAIGREVARRAKSCHMKVIAVRRDTRRPSKPADQVLPPRFLDRALAPADAVVLAVPFTRETRLLLKAEGLAKMKQSAFLINVSRGRVVDEPALIEALRMGRIGGAGLDVFWEEPLPPESPLWTLPNVIVTPHYAGMHEGHWLEVCRLFAKNIDRFLKGQKLLNEVNKELGY